jgi:Ca-activated chloride channel family protein
MLQQFRVSLCRPRLAAWLMVAVTFVTCQSQIRAAGMLVASGGFGGVLTIKEHDARVTINNGIAVTEAEQVFVNTEKRVVEALYTFPVPKGASVANFSMWINGKEMIGEVVEKQRARQIYESYKQVRRDPGLLEQVDYKTFEMRIFPIPAEAEQRVRITYYQELDFDHDSATYVYPLATTTAKGINQQTTGRFSLALDVKSEVPVVEIKSPSHADEFAIVKHASDRYVQASLEATGGDMSRDLVIALKTARPRTGLDFIASRTDGEDGYFQLTFTAGKELEDATGGADYVFLLDVSGSMARDGKLSMSRNSLAAFVNSLGPDDRLELITFDVGAHPLFGSLAPVNEKQKEAVRQFLESQKARGGTVLRPAMETAYRYRDQDRPLNVVVLSDGMTEQREQAELLDLIRRRPSGTTVFCVGVGNDVNRPLLSQLANDAGGLAAFISMGDDFERQAEAFRRKLVRPAATNVQLSFAGGDVYDLEPKELPSLYHGQPLRIYGRYRQAGPVKVHVAADILGNPLKQAVNLELPRREAVNPEIERMWASRKVDRLMNESRRVGSNGLHQDEIVRLCEGYSIVSEYASFIVLENGNEYARWKIERRNATRVARDRQAQEAVRKQLEGLRRETAKKLGPADGSDAERATSAETRSALRPTTEVAQAPVNIPTPQLVTPPPMSDRDFDISPSRSSGGGSGGGAIDPLTALAATGLMGMGLVVRRRRGKITGHEG